MTEKKALNIVTPDGVVKIGVKVVGGDTMALAGKYSLSFIKEMAAQLTPIIESAVSVSGLAESGLSLQIIFAPNTFMEHISDNVTYRRLLLLDGVSAPRDFWVKWTRLDGAVAFPMWAEVSSENILFELGEDVFQKIREKEYRYLLAENAGEYHDAMSRKNVTEWRDIIKRAVRRGDLTRVEIEEEISPETIELEARLADILGRSFVKKEDTVPEFSAPEDDKFELAMQKVREVVEGAPVDEAAPDEPDYEPDAEEDEDEFPELSDEQAELDEITRMALEALQFSKQNVLEEEAAVSEVAYSESILEIGYEEFSLGEECAPAVAEEPVSEAEFEVEITVGEEEIPDEPIEEPVIPEEPVVEEPVVEEPVAFAQTFTYREEDIRAELEAKIRLEYENKARMRAEEELAELRRERERMKEENERLRLEAQREQEKLRAEYERLYEQSRRAQAVRDAKEALRRSEEEKLREEIESQLRAEAMERERLAEAARLAIEEKHRIQAEADRAMRAREEEMRVAEDQRRREEAKAHLEAARQAEIERIRREAEEQRVAAMKAMPVMEDCKYTYTSKTVKLIFRRSVDPNITSRIHEIIKATLEYYGKDRVYLKIKASVPDSQTVCLEFVHIPMEEMQLLGNIIKILGNSGLGIAKAIIE